MIRIRPTSADEILIRRTREWYEPGLGPYFKQFAESVTPSSGFIALDSSGTSYSVPLTVLNSSGTSYLVGSSVLSSGGTVYNPI